MSDDAVLDEHASSADDHFTISDPDPPLTFVEREPALVLAAVTGGLTACVVLATAAWPRAVGACVAGVVAGGAAAAVRQRVSPYADPELEAGVRDGG